MIFSSKSEESHDINQSLAIYGWYEVYKNIFDNLEKRDKEYIRMYTDSLKKERIRKRSVVMPISFCSIIKVALKNEIYEAIKIYLKTERPYFYQPHILVSAPFEQNKQNNKKLLSDFAFSYHRDYDNVRWLKLFVNLTETTGGSHEYVEGSHYTKNRMVDSTYSNRSCGLEFEDQFKPRTTYESHIWTGRFCKQSIEMLYGTDKIRRFSTKAGYTWIEDSYGLHRGNAPVEGNRCVAAFLIGKYPIRF